MLSWQQTSNGCLHQIPAGCKLMKVNQKAPRPTSREPCSLCMMTREKLLGMKAGTPWQVGGICPPPPPVSRNFLSSNIN